MLASCDLAIPCSHIPYVFPEERVMAENEHAVRLEVMDIISEYFAWEYTSGEISIENLHEAWDKLLSGVERRDVTPRSHAPHPCPEAHATFENCPTSRLQATNCLFEYFAPEETPDEIPVEVLREAWIKLLNEAQRRVAGSVENVIEACNPTRAPAFSRSAMLANRCHCMENCTWTTRVQLVCNLAKKNPNWRDRRV